MNNRIMIVGMLINLFNENTSSLCVANDKVSLFEIVKFIFINVIIVGGIISKLKNIFLLNLNFSFDAILVIYINRISIPPTIIRNKI